MAAKRVLMLLAPGFEEIEALTPVDLLRRAGIDVVIASVLGAELVTGRSNITVKTDRNLDDTDPGAFDLLLVPGGPGVKALRADGRAAHLAKAFAEARKPVAAICAGPAVLHDAGVLSGRRYTAHFSVYDELSDALADERVVEDDDVITSRGAGTALDFGLALVRRLAGEAKAAEVAKAIMA